jgi:DNA polymerase-3 subunit gamma/tau
MSLALYRRYRPSSFKDVIGQEHVTTPLSNALDSARIHHAYLFSGPRGCGKTSSARIMARSLNCAKGPTSNPCGDCQSCKDLVANGPGSVDVIELDAATHGLVDDARDLRDKAFFSPVASRYKIYIIDEAHQLGPGAANALLKVVEEPPPHVLFIFATTEPDKLIATIRSRTHHYPFRLVPPGILQEHLQKICDLEGVKVEKGVLPLVVRASGGSVRDSLSVMGQLLAGAGKDGVKYEIAVQLLGFTDAALLDEAVDSIAAQDLGSLLLTIDRLIESGHDPRRFAQDLLERLRDLFVIFTIEDEAKSILRNLPDELLYRMQAQARLIGGANLSRGASVVAEGLNQMRGATSPRLILELICSRIVIGNVDGSVDGSELGVLARLERLERRSQIESPKAPMAKAEPSKVRIAYEVAPKVTEGKPIPSLDIDVTSLRRMWPDVIENVKKKRRLTWSLLSTSAQILAVDENRITIGIMNAGARDSFIRSESDVILADAFNEVTGLKRIIEVVVDASVISSANLNQPQRADEDESDKNQLVGAELLMKELGAKVISESEK